LDPVPEKLRKMEEQQIKKEEESHFIIATLAIKSGILGIKLPSEKEPFYLTSDKSTEYMNLLYPEKLDQKGRKKRNDKINKGNTKVEVRVRTHANFTDILELRPLEANKE
ncbi:hypothetical protein ACTVFP_22905, partial [Escherichia coli]|uniref:hypothetical protein n=1 Tax=Escherichia coli TaxID=562 RepID=UPI003FA5822C